MPPKQQSCLFAGIILLVFLALGNVQANGIKSNHILKTRSSVTGTPNIILLGSPFHLNTTAGTASGTTSFSVSGTDMEGPIQVIAPAGNSFEISTDKVTYSTLLTVGAAGMVAPIAIYVRLKAGATIGINTADITINSTNEMYP
jgi:hypothetical protein